MFRMFGLFSLLPVLSIYAADLEGATPMLIGLAVGAYGLTQAALQIPLGALSDRVGRMPVILGGLAVFAAGSLVAAESSTIAGVVAGRFLQGAGAISSTLTALLADVTRTAVRTRTMAVYGVGVGSSILLALVFGPVIAAAGGVQGVFLVGVFVAGIAALLMFLVPKGDRQPVPRAPLNLRLAFQPALLKLDFYVFLLHALLTALFVAMPFVLRNDLDLGLGDHWKIYVGALLASLLAAVPLIVADDRQGKRGTMRVALLFQLTGLTVLALAGKTVLTVGAGLACFFVGLNFLEAALPARLSVLADERQRGASLGVFSSAQFLGAFAGGLFGGWLLSSGRPADVFLFGAAVIGAWLVFHHFGFLGRNAADSPEI